MAISTTTTKTGRPIKEVSLKWLDWIILWAILLMFEHQLNRHEKRFRNMIATAVLEKD